MVGGSHRRFPRDSHDDLGTPPADDACQGNAGCERIKQATVGKGERLTHLNAQNSRRFHRFGKTRLRSRASRSRFAVGQIADSDAMALLDETCEDSADRDFDIVRMGTDREDIQSQWQIR